MKNRKGFTIVELVIVIAVIAILAAVLIPTFSGVVSKANASAAVQEARTSLANILSTNTQGSLNKAYFFIENGSNSYRVDYENQKLNEEVVTGTDRGSKAATLANVADGATYADYCIVVKDYTAFTDKEWDSIKAALGITGSAITPAAVDGQEFRSLTVEISSENVVFKVFYNVDLSGNCAVFIY